MPEIAIHVENLSKLYHIGKAQRRADTLRDAVVGAFNCLKAPRFERSNGDDTIWALKDISFEIKRGKVVGIIGRNGAGKSTLLKILSRITEPTKGRAIIEGRVGSLLEVGTGFHPELTGRENIYLNGAILGMKKSEIERNFDEIVSFAEIEKFLDTPVKHYSSGMYVRLAFAVAAHLEPEILLVDEVLAVGDAEFQKKCLRKMGAVAEEGRTVLFVSHNMQAVRQLCERALLLDHGHVDFEGLASDVTHAYFGGLASNSKVSLLQVERKGEARDAYLETIAFLGGDGASSGQFCRKGRLRIEVAFRVAKALIKFNVSMAIVHSDGFAVFSEALSDQQTPMPLDPGGYAIQFDIDLSYLKLESYFLSVYLLDNWKALDNVDGVPLPELVDPDADVYMESRRWGIVRIPLDGESSTRKLKTLLTIRIANSVSS